MGAAQSTNYAGGERVRPYNNADAVHALMMHHYTRAQQAGSDAKPARCPVPHGPRGAMAPPASGEAPLNPLNQMPELSQERAHMQQTELSRERVVSSIPRARTSAAPGDSPYAAPQCPIPHDQRGGAAEQARSAACPVAPGHGSSDDSPGYWEYPSPQQFYNALVRKGWETPEEHVDMMVMIHNFLNERAWQEIVDWERMAGSDVSQLQLARFQGRPGTLSPRARMFGWLAWLFPSKFSAEPPFDRHDWIVKRGPTETNPDGEEVRYIIDYYSDEDESAEETEGDEASFHLDVRPAIADLATLQLRWKKLLQEYESGELLAPFRESSSAS